MSAVSAIAARPESEDSAIADRWFPCFLPEIRLARQLRCCQSVALSTTPSARTVIGCAIKVHRELGAGLFESVYGPCLAFEMTSAGLQFNREVACPLVYHGLSFKRAFR